MHIHGSGYWDRHTDAFDAMNHFSTTNTPFKLNQYGGSVGFPIIKDKAFGFVSYQAFHLNDQFPSHITLPTPAQIFDATQCVETGVNPNTSGTVGPDGVTPWTTCLNNGPGLVVIKFLVRPMMGPSIPLGRPYYRFIRPALQGKPISPLTIRWI